MLNTVKEIAVNCGYFIGDVDNILKELRIYKRKLDYFHRLQLRKNDPSVQEVLGVIDILNDRLYSVVSNIPTYMGQKQ